MSTEGRDHGKIQLLSLKSVGSTLLKTFCRKRPNKFGRLRINVLNEHGKSVWMSTSKLNATSTANKFSYLHPN